jgi:hypothetical protein
MGFADIDFQIGDTNLTANTARFLLMACRLKFGSLKPQKNDRNARVARGSVTIARQARA